MLVIEKIVLKRLAMRLKQPVSTSYGTFQDKEFFLIEVHGAGGEIGYGESAAFSTPWYTEETVVTTEHVIQEFLIPLLFKDPIEHPDEVFQRFRGIRRNNMAKAALEGAVWDLYAKKKKISLANALGGSRTSVDVGISIGIQESLKALIKVIQEKLDLGYKRVKIKIKPEWDVKVIDMVRSVYPRLPLMVDANSAYSLDQIDLLKKLDAYNLLMIEQPLAHDDIVDHAKLQENLKTPICLDESIHSFDDARHAIELGSCQVINIKIARVGGLSEAKRIHDYCYNRGLPVWCGGMYEAGVGRAQSIALAALPGFSLPGDTAASANYWEQDIIEPEVVMENGCITVPIEPGIGYTLNQQAIKKYIIDERIFERD